MLRVKNLRNKYQKRTLRVIYSNTQAQAYAGVLDSTLRDAAGAFVRPLSGVGTPARSADAFVLQNGLVPGTVVVKAAGESFKVAVGNTTERPFGLLANFVGGDLDELGDENSIGVWRGVNSVVELLAPAFNPSGIADGAGSTGTLQPLYAGTDGRLTATNPGGGAVVVARLIDYVAPSRIVVDMAI